MSNLALVLSQAKALSEQEQQELLTQLEEYLVLGSQITQVIKEVKEMRFSKGRVCCHCGGTDVVRNGKNKGVQRYLCRCCNKSFSDLTKSATYKSKKPLDKWLKYAKCMLNGYSIRKSAEIVEINIATSFYWRHKILNCISEFLGVGSVDGVVEADEVFFPYSYKGTKPANMPRPSRKRGKQVKKRGISNEQVCVATAIDRQGNLIIELLCTGRMTSEELKRLYGNRIGEESILCTDSHKSYMQFAIDLSLEHKRIKRGKHKEDIYHIQHINSLHSNLKKWMSRFNGVATKYLSNYLKWHKWMDTFSSEKESIRTKNLILHSNIPHSYTMVKEFKTREPIFI
ncbi:IS1595 family transposase [Clostridium tertium]|jgi:transposase-like protein|uniref:IS1595 family transposase n=1 Tax=Clostridium tertium TaxID=1559 RepID=UPI000C08ACF5|nr:IS1595 family transposase [Clostridium tertium]MDU1568433.1 IS1595 family transposase [Clostridium sp.]MDB1956416.1 IS1595 family transposase [Clostridium tertium]MDB1960346.1 IS1595 family transposase [Clostridium tertium]MDB1961535.1 IS1595 family transposase [Clostridium tertium]MDB1967392.1 IS1595 family transposase [Clostridium tertium]